MNTRVPDVRWRLLCGEAVRGLHTGGSGSLAVWESTSLSPLLLGFQVGDIGARRVHSYLGSIPCRIHVPVFDDVATYRPWDELSSVRVRNLRLFAVC